MRAVVAPAAGAVAGLALLVACGADEPSTYRPGAVTCTAQSRAADGSGAAESVSMTVDRRDGLDRRTDTADVGPFTLAVTFQGEAPEGDTVLIQVEGGAGDRLAQDLFQYGGTDALAAQFAGGHGFTGLRYLYDGDAELQYFCAAG